VNLAFLGCGGVTRRHSRTLARLGGVTRFYASRDAGRAEACNRELGGAGAFGSYAAALEDPRVDAVLVATPPDTHLSLALDALAAGKHVIVEKPPFLRSADFDRVEAAAARASRQAMVAENYFYKPLASALREVVAAGELGAIRIVHVNALKRQEVSGWRTRAEMAGGGALFEGGIHWVSFMASLGLEVEDATGFLPGGATPEDERTAVAVFRYAGGAIGTLHHSWEIPSPLRGVRLSALYGTEGTATFESNGLFLAVRGRRRRLTPLRPLDLVGFSAMFRDFTAAIREDRPPRYTLALARRDLALVERIYGTATAPSPTS
jgi:UDP-N-acetylglucosamine 3-dehydrogenase